MLPVIFSKYDTYVQTDQMKRKLKKLKYLEVDQMPGEMLFLPTGWFHQVGEPSLDRDWLIFFGSVISWFILATD